MVYIQENGLWSCENHKVQRNTILRADSDVRGEQKPILMSKIARYQSADVILLFWCFYQRSEGWIITF